MKKYLVLTISIFILFSCNKIEPEKNYELKNLNKSNEIKYHLSEKNCWVHSCALQEYLLSKYENNELNLPDLEYYKKRFELLLNTHKTKDELIKSPNFKIFVSELNKDFFWCEWDIYKCKWTNPYWYDETNFLFYIFIPKLVVEDFILKRWWNESDWETIIQSIKRKDFVSFEEKEKRVIEYKENLKQIINKMDLSKIDKENLKTDLKYFEEIILNPITWIHDNIIKEIPWIKIDWEEWDQIDRVVEFTNNEFYKIIEWLWISKDLFKKKVAEVYNIKWENFPKEINSLMQKKTQFMNKKYNLHLKMPLDRYYRNDELSIFSKENLDNFSANWWDWDKLSFEKDALEMRHLVFLLFNFWAEEKLYTLTNWLTSQNFEEKFLLTNIFKYAKYLKYENIYINF